ncbi:MAG: hypothetical protein IT473_00265 [Lysobacter sp.]|nr:hypothetical protein [Lysobacter sp.]
MQNKKTFAFQLASTQKADTKTDGKTWQVRDGVAVAGCTDPTRQGDFRADYDIWGTYRGRDKGYWC